MVSHRRLQQLPQTSSSHRLFFVQLAVTQLGTGPDMLPYASVMPASSCEASTNRECGNPSNAKHLDPIASRIPFSASSWTKKRLQRACSPRQNAQLTTYMDRWGAMVEMAAAFHVDGLGHQPCAWMPDPWKANQAVKPDRFLIGSFSAQSFAHMLASFVFLKGVMTSRPVIKSYTQISLPDSSALQQPYEN